jgi:hypothetical protein
LEEQKIFNINSLTEDAKWKDLYLKGDTYKNYATIIVIAHRGREEMTKKCDCGKDVKFDFWHGFHPWVVQSWKRFIKPMNVPVIEMVMSGYEVGDAYNKAIEHILTDPALKPFHYILFLEDDIIVPFMPHSYGPLIELYKHLEKYDVAGGLYWTKGEPSLPLIYGDGNWDDGPMPFSVNLNWEPGAIVEVNGCGMGFTLMKRSIFEDAKFEKPYFETVNKILQTHPISYTQDLYFCEKIKKMGYKICIDTNIKCGHLDFKTEQVF